MSPRADGIPNPVGAFDPLVGFLQWALGGNIPTIGAVPLLGAVHKVEDVVSVTWYRAPPFQIQMFIVPPGYVIPEHTHPNVDSFEVYLGGQMRFSHSGKFLFPAELLDLPDAQGLAQMRGDVVRVRPGDLHGGTFGASGGVFMSVQHWLNGVEPHCVASDYSGPTLGPAHFANVVAGEPELREQASLTAKDAAGRE
jgi:hypothetical protein